MKIRLKGIQFQNYKNIQNGQILLLDDITTLVGANESGKTNVLNAIECLVDSLQPSNDKLGAPRKAAILKFLLEVCDEELKDFLTMRTKNYSGSDLLLLEKENEEVQLSLADESFRAKAIQPNSKWQNVSGQQIDIGGIKLEPDQQFYPNELPKSNLMQLAKKKLIDRVEENSILEEIRKDLIEHLPEVESWDYRGDKEDEAEYYIPNSVPWQQFIDDPDSSSPTKNLFLAVERENEKLTNFQQQLKNLGDDGTQIQNFLNKVSDTINSLIKKVWSQSIFEIRLTYQSDSLRIDTYEGGELKPPSVRSEGMKWFLSFLIDFHVRGKLEEKIILFDQPGERLHPGGQKELRVRLARLVPENQIIYATQSPFLIDRNNWASVRFLKKIRGETKISLPSKEDVENDELLRSSLGFTLADVGQANEFNIVTEGFTDSFILLEWSRKLNEENVKNHTAPVIDLNKTAIFDKHGRGSIRKGVTELESSGLTTVGLFDADTEGLGALRDAKRNRSLLKHFISFQDCLGVTSRVKTGEDLVPQSIFRNACKLIFSGISKTHLKNIIDHPRWENICRVRNLSDSNKKDIKDRLWEVIIENIKTERLEADMDESVSARKILESCRDLLSNIYDEKQRKI